MNRTPVASVIIAIYKDVEALNCVLAGLLRQSAQDFEVIVTEDGNDPAVADYIANRAPRELELRHLTQEDNGFRKTRAVNRAIADARAPYLIFLDGDCVPHPRFVEMHLCHAEPARICVGRRVHLGPGFSVQVRKHPEIAAQLAEPGIFLRKVIALHRDGVRNYELGFPNGLFHRLARHRHLQIVGCNFSCYRADMVRINGYDEDLPGIGGEDDDLEWRFNGLGMFTKNIKFQAITYHLWHPSRRQDTEINQQISRRNREQKLYFCRNGIRKNTSSASMG